MPRRSWPAMPGSAIEVRRRASREMTAGRASYCRAGRAARDPERPEMAPQTPHIRQAASRRPAQLRQSRHAPLPSHSKARRRSASKPLLPRVSHPFSLAHQVMTDRPMIYWTEPTTSTHKWSGESPRRKDRLCQTLTGRHRAGFPWRRRPAGVSPGWVRVRCPPGPPRRRCLVT